MPLSAPDFEHLITDRLRLRLPAERDAAELLALYGDPQVMRQWRHAPWRAWRQALDEVAEARADLAAGRALHLVLVTHRDARLAGSCALFDIHPQHRRATLGYLLASAYWRQGLGREAVQALLEHGFDALGLERVEAEVDPRNGASRALLRRLGFHCEGLLRARWQVGGQARDVELWALLRRDWPA